MTEDFPKLKEGQVALSRADVNTGTVLDEQNKYALSPSQRVYTVFDDETTALSAASLLVSENPSIECYIHAQPDRLLYFLDSKGTKQF